MKPVAFYNFSSIFKAQTCGSPSKITDSELWSSCDKMGAALGLGELLAF